MAWHQAHRCAPIPVEIGEYASNLFPKVAAAISYKPEFVGSSPGDLENDLWLALLQRHSLYDANRGTASTFVAMVTNDAVASMIRKPRAHMRNRRREECSFDDQVRDGDGEQVRRESVLFLRNQDRQRQLREELDQALDELPEHLSEFALALIWTNGNISKAASRCRMTPDKARWCVEALRERFGDAELYRFL